MHTATSTEAFIYIYIYMVQNLSPTTNPPVCRPDLPSKSRKNADHKIETTPPLL